MSSRIGRPPRPIRERFNEKYVVDANTGCWVWTSGFHRAGYAQFRLEGRTRIGHRVAYELFVGPIPEGLEIDHLCRNKACVNPAHLEPVTQRENLRRRSAALPRKTHCIRGHAFDESNTHVLENGTRRCRACGAEHAREKARIERIAVEEAREQEFVVGPYTRLRSLLDAPSEMAA